MFAPAVIRALLLGSQLHKTNGSEYELSSPILKRYVSDFCRKHLVKDIFPYTCPIEGCTTSVLYLNKKTWQQHLLDQHQVVTHWECSLCNDQPQFTKSADFDMHLRKEHIESFFESDLLQMRDASQQTRISLSQLCPTCNEAWEIDQYESFIDHLAECIHDFSLRSLP